MFMVAIGKAKLVFNSLDAFPSGRRPLHRELIGSYKLTSRRIRFICGSFAFGGGFGCIYPRWQPQQLITGWVGGYARARPILGYEDRRGDGLQQRLEFVPPPLSLFASAQRLLSLLARADVVKNGDKEALGRAVDRNGQVKSQRLQIYLESFCVAR